jgi:hypothetical protein
VVGAGDGAAVTGVGRASSSTSGTAPINSGTYSDGWRWTGGEQDEHKEELELVVSEWRVSDVNEVAVVVVVVVVVVEES